MYLFRNFGYFLNFRRSHQLNFPLLFILRSKFSELCIIFFLISEAIEWYVNHHSTHVGTNFMARWTYRRPTGADASRLISTRAHYHLIAYFVQVLYIIRLVILQSHTCSVSTEPSITFHTFIQTFCAYHHSLPYFKH